MGFVEVGSLEHEDWNGVHVGSATPDLYIDVGGLEKQFH